MESKNVQHVNFPKPGTKKINGVKLQINDEMFWNMGNPSFAADLSAITDTKKKIMKVNWGITMLSAAP